MSDDVKVKVPETALAPMIQQFKVGLGNLTHSEYIGSQQEIESYIAIFERSGPVLHINFNKSNLIVGFFVVPDPREGPGSITLNTGTATLKATHSVPQVTMPIPVVLLIAGSGPTDRDGNSQLVSGKSNYLLQISDSLKLKNVAVLRYEQYKDGQFYKTEDGCWL